MMRHKTSKAKLILHLDAALLTALDKIANSGRYIALDRDKLVRAIILKAAA